MDEFSVSSADMTVKGISGEDVSLTGHPKIKIMLSSSKPLAGQVKVRLIRSGSLVHSVEGTLPLQIEYDDAYFKPGEKIYYRMDMRGAGIIVSNPIFVNFVK
jgi:hypothetical protein